MRLQLSPRHTRCPSRKRPPSAPSLPMLSARFAWTPRQRGVSGGGGIDAPDGAVGTCRWIRRTRECSSTGPNAVCGAKACCLQLRSSSPSLRRRLGLARSALHARSRDIRDAGLGGLQGSRATVLRSSGCNRQSLLSLLRSGVRSSLHMTVRNTTLRSSTSRRCSTHRLRRTQRTATRGHVASRSRAWMRRWPLARGRAGTSDAGRRLPKQSAFISIYCWGSVTEPRHTLSTPAPGSMRPAIGSGICSRRRSRPSWLAIRALPEARLGRNDGQAGAGYTGHAVRLLYARAARKPVHSRTRERRGELGEHRVFAAVR